jgi:hypothetical protein
MAGSGDDLIKNYSEKLTDSTSRLFSENLLD